MVNVSSILTVTTTKTTIMTIYEAAAALNELQLINEFEQDFNITPQSKERREELISKLHLFGGWKINK